jgi:FdhE protein
LGKKKKTDSEAEKIRKRVEIMVKERPSHKDVVEFFGDVVAEQHSIRSKVKTVPIQVDEEDFKEKMGQGFSLIEKRALTIDIPVATRLFKRLCKILSRNKKASTDAERITKALKNKKIDLLELLKQGDSNNTEYISALARNLGVKEDVLIFLVKNSMKPIFEAYAKELGTYVDQERWWKGYCPICGSEPCIAELKNVGGVEGARFLVCSSCSFEWRYKRLQCPFCGHEAVKGAKYFHTEKEGKAYRIDVCEECRRYIKTIDTNELGEEVIPIIEDAGTLYLDILAEKEGYTKEGMSSKLPVNA